MCFSPFFIGKRANMHIKYINHYTANTSHNRLSYPDEVDKKLYFKLKGIISDAVNGKKPKISDCIYMTLTVDADCYVATLWLNDNTPLMTTLGADDVGGRCKIHKLIMGDYANFIPRTIIIPDCPVIVDVILPPSILRPNIFEWTGDFTRCLGWMLIAPDKIRP